MPQKNEQDIEVLVPLEVISKFDQLFLLCGVKLTAFHRICSSTKAVHSIFECYSFSVIMLKKICSNSLTKLQH
jgi:hypothetical protein